MPCQLRGEEMIISVVAYVVDVSVEEEVDVSLEIDIFLTPAAL